MNSTYTSKAFGQGGCTSCAAMSVDLTTGVLNVNTDGPLLAGLGFPVKLSYGYTSHNQVNGIFGHGRGSLGEPSRAVVDMTEGDAYGNILMHQDAGYSLVYSGDGDGVTWSQPGDETDVVVKNEDGSWTETLAGQKTIEYDSYGLVQSMTDVYGHTHYYQYDTGDNYGNILSIIDASGRASAFGYGTNNKVSSFQDWGGRTTYFEYDDTQDTLVKITGPELCQTYFEYDTSGRVTCILDSDGYSAEYTYADDAYGNVTSETVSGVGTTYFDFDWENQRTIVTDPLGNLTYYTYEDYAITSTNKILSSGESIYEEFAGNIVRVDASENASYYAYDQYGNRMYSIDQLGNTTYSKYDEFGNLLANTDANGNSSYSESDSYGNLTCSTNKEGNSTYYTYNDDGLMLSEQNPLGSMTYYEYDAYGNRTAEIDAFSNASYFEYDSFGKRVAETNRRGFTNYFEYDLCDRLVKTTDALGNTREFGYTPSGQKNVSVDALGNATYFEYNAFRKQTSRVTPDGAASYFVYDAAAQLTQEIDPLGNATTYSYDAAGRQESATNALLQTTQSVYDKNSRLTAQVDALGNANYFEYDAAGRQTAACDALGNTSYFEYDANGRQYQTTTPNGSVTYYEFDVMGRQTAVTSAYGTLDYTTYYEYDANGNQLSAVDPRGNKNSFAYDAARRLTRSSVTHENDSYTTLLLHCDGDSFGDTEFKDSSGRGHEISSTGVIVNTNLQKFGTASARFNDNYFNYYTSYLTIPYSTDFEFEAGDFTIDFWVYPRYTYYQTSLCTFATPYHFNVGLDSSNNVQLFASDNGTEWSLISGYDEGQGSVSLSVDTWHHVAVVRNGNNWRTYIDGVKDLDITVSGEIFTRSEAFRLGMPDEADDTVGTAYPFYGCIDEFRISKGIARWTDEFDVPTRPYDVHQYAHTYFTYDEEGNQTSVTDALGHTNTSAYDALNRVSVQTDALDGSTYFEYDANGNRTASVDPMGRASYFVYDNMNRVAASIDALGQASYFDYDLAGNQTDVTDARGQTTSTAYDALNRVSVTTDAAGSSTYFEYDANGNRTGLTNALGYANSFGYDALNRVTVATDALANSSYFAYDAVGNRTGVIDPRGNESSFEYDELNRLSATTDSLGNTSYFSYDANGNMTQTLDPLENASSFEYDPRNLLTASTDALGSTTYFAYDLNGNRTSLTDALQQTTDYGYDALNRVVSITDALAQSEYYEYDAASNLTAATNAAADTTYFEYDSLNRQTAVVYPVDSSCSFGYDAVGNLTSASGENGISTFSYDAVNRLTEEVSSNGTASHGYDLLGRRTSLTSPSATESSDLSTYYSYDAANRMSSVRGESESGEVYVYGSQPYGTSSYGGGGQFDGMASYTYDETSNLVAKVMDNGTSSGFTYDAVNRLTQIDNALSSGTNTYFAYDYDAAGRITSVQRQAGLTTSYSYDAASRLTGETWTEDGTEIYAFSYDYDAVGNRIYENNNGTETYFTYDAANEMTQAYNATDDSTTSYSYDAMGNCLSIADADGTTYFTYNDANLVTSITYPDSTVNYFYYDGLMRRYAMEDSAGLTYFVWDKGGLNLLTEKDASGNVTAEYIHGYSPVTGIGSLVAAKKTVDGTAYYQYPQYDHRGTVVGLTDKTGAVIASYEYNAFGEVISADESTDVQAAGNRFRYQSNWMVLGDSGGRFYLSAARVYDAKLGRFLQRDPLYSVNFLGHRFAFNTNSLVGITGGDPFKCEDGLSRYAYCGNSPMIFEDPYGLFAPYYNWKRNIENKAKTRADYEREKKNDTSEAPATPMVAPILLAIKLGYMNASTESEKLGWEFARWYFMGNGHDFTTHPSGLKEDTGVRVDARLNIFNEVRKICKDGLGKGRITGKKSIISRDVQPNTWMLIQTTNIPSKGFTQEISYDLDSCCNGTINVNYRWMDWADMHPEKYFFPDRIVTSIENIVMPFSKHEYMIDIKWSSAINVKNLSDDVNLKYSGDWPFEE